MPFPELRLLPSIVKNEKYIIWAGRGISVGFKPHFLPIKRKKATWGSFDVWSCVPRKCSFARQHEDSQAPGFPKIVVNRLYYLIMAWADWFWIGVSDPSADGLWLDFWCHSTLQHPSKRTVLFRTVWFMSWHAGLAEKNHKLTIWLSRKSHRASHSPQLLFSCKLPWGYFRLEAGMCGIWCGLGLGEVVLSPIKWPGTPGIQPSSFAFKFILPLKVVLSLVNLRTLPRTLNSGHSLQKGTDS